MKRSEINAILRKAEAMFAGIHFLMPKFAAWGPEDYRRNAADYPELQDCQLGWDITDFGSGDFEHIGLTLVTIRNGVLNHPVYRKPYCEKIMMVGVKQVTPLHFHENKIEDIINRGGGKLVFQFYNHVPGSMALADTPVRVRGDGHVYEIPAGGTIAIEPGQSLTLETGTYHAFWAEEAPCVVGEVSCVNDDHTDNRFYQAPKRFPDIDEDVAPYRLLVGDYPKFQK